MEKIVLQFSRGYGPANGIIRVGTWSWATHVDVVFPDREDYLYGAAGLMKGTSGVMFRRPGQYARTEQYLVHVSRRVGNKVVDALLSQEGKPYDWLGVLGVMFRQSNWQSQDCWFCSELVAWAFLQGDYPLLNTDQLERITPRDLLLSPMLKRIQ